MTVRSLPSVALAACLAAAPVYAGTTCGFTTECYMTEPCTDTDWELSVDLATGVLSTAFGDLEILHVEDGRAPQITARGDGSLNLLTVGEPVSVFTTHIGADPAVISYVGECVTE